MSTNKTTDKFGVEYSTTGATLCRCPTGHFGSYVVPEGVKNIDSRAFEDCQYLKRITLPKSLKYIGGFAFRDCRDLKEVYYEGTFADWCELKFATATSSPCCNEAKLFIQGKELIDVGFPDEISEIKNYAFFGCTSITNVVMQENINRVGEQSFSECVNLREVTMFGEIETISDGAFEYCTSLIGIHLPPVGMFKIGSRAFAHCKKLRHIVVPQTVEQINKFAFYRCDELEEINLPASLAAIGDSAFGDCRQLSTVIFEGNLERWCGIQFISFDSNPLFFGAFLYVNDGELVEEVLLPSTVSEIGYSFAGCSSIKKATIPEDTEYVPEMAFARCKSLSCVVLHDKITSIQERAFESCTNLKHLFVPASIETMAPYVAPNCEIAFYCEDEPTKNWPENWNARGGKNLGKHDVTTHAPRWWYDKFVAQT